MKKGAVPAGTDFKRVAASATGPRSLYRNRIPYRLYVPVKSMLVCCVVFPEFLIWPVNNFFQPLNPSTMANANEISTEIQTADITAIEAAIASIKAKLQPVLLFNLTDEDRKGIAKMADKTIPFVSKALDYADQNGNLVPPYMDLPEAKKDLALARELYRLMQLLQPIVTALDDTYTVAGSEAYDAARSFYNYVLGATKQNVAGTQAIYDDLKQRFPGRSRKALKLKETKEQ